MITIDDVPKMCEFAQTVYNFLNPFNSILPSISLDIISDKYITVRRKINYAAMGETDLFKVTLFLKNITTELQKIESIIRIPFKDDSLLRTIIIHTIIHELKHIEQQSLKESWENPPDSKIYEKILYQIEWENECETLKFLMQNLPILEKRFGRLEPIYIECMTDIIKDASFSNFLNKDIGYKRITDPLYNTRLYFTYSVLKPIYQNKINYEALLHECENFNVMIIPPDNTEDVLELMLKENGIWNSYFIVNNYLEQIFKYTNLYCLYKISHKLSKDHKNLDLVYHFC